MDDTPLWRIRKRARTALDVDSVIAYDSIRRNVAAIDVSRPNDVVQLLPPIAINETKQNHHHHHYQRIQEGNSIFIGHGCLLIPAIFLMWWYWTKRTARRVVRGVITFTRGSSSQASSMDPSTTICSGDNDDIGPYFNGCADTTQPSSPNASSPPNGESSSYYRSWEDQLPPEGSPSDSSSKFRFIHWMKRTKTSRTRQKVRAATLHNLHNNTNNSMYNGSNETELSSSSTKAIELIVDGNSGNDVCNSNVDTATFVTHIQQQTNNPHHTNVEMFVIEYPQPKSSHPSRNNTATTTTSMMV